MIATLKNRLDAWQRDLNARFGGDISTTKARKAARLHYQLMDHGFLRVLWRNLHEIAPGVYRSNQPSDKQLTAMHRRLGLRTVLNLRGPSSQSFHLFEAETCHSLGMTLIDLPMSANSAPSREKLEDLYRLFQTMEKPFLIHCKSGADRTGLAAALYLLLIEKAPISVARQQLSLKYIHIAKSPAGISDHVLRVYHFAYKRNGISFLDWLHREYDPVKVTDSFKRWRAGDRSLA